MKPLFTALLFFALLPYTASSSVTVSFGAGTFYSSTDTSVPAPVGTRVNILALNSGSWGNATELSNLFSSLTNSFVPSNATLVAQFATDDTDGPGTSATNFIYDYAGAFDAGDQLLMVVYPTLTLLNSAPGLNAPGFFFRTDAIIDDSDIAWIAPSDGATVQLFAYTTALGGSLPNDQFTAGAGATGGNGFTTIPEPSSAALLLFGSAAFLWLRKRRTA